jgi:DNA repair protein RadA/Sms
MAKPPRRFVCQSCGAVTPRWLGQCEACQAWNTIVEETAEARPGPARAATGARGLTILDLAASANRP